jgi:hypothetical protein
MLGPHPRQLLLRRPCPVDFSELLANPAQRTPELRIVRQSFDGLRQGALEPKGVGAFLDLIRSAGLGESGFRVSVGERIDGARAWIECNKVGRPAPGALADPRAMRVDCDRLAKH